MQGLQNKSSPVLVDVRSLRVDLPIGQFGRRKLRAVDGVDLTIARGDVHGLVGETGCGKSTTGRALIRLARPTEGQVLFGGVDIASLSRRKLNSFRPRMQMIFQHPGSALNPRIDIGRSIAEPLAAAGVVRADRRARVIDMLLRVGLPATSMDRYPHDLSGGQLQRVTIARALVGRPEFVVADEPVSSLDLSIQAQVMVLFKELQRELGISSLFITHDLGIAEYVSTYISVMYLGKLVETAPAYEFSKRAQHPYSRMLFDSVPRLDPKIERTRQVQQLSGEMPSPLAPPPGCRFHTRCPLVQARCRVEAPPTKNIGAGHTVACWVV